MTTTQNFTAPAALPELVAALRALRPAIVTIDGPAASGKSTIGYRLAQLADFLFFDTGVMYRALTWAALQAGLDVRNEDTMTTLAEQTSIVITAPAAGVTDGRQCTVQVDGADITWAIRTPQVDQNVSAVSVHPPVREAMCQQQRRIGQQYSHGLADKAGVVMVGRDIGTVVMPGAPLKIYMDASAEERAHRRYAEQRDQGKVMVFATLLADIVRRDKLDSERAHSPLRQAPDAYVLDTSTLTPDEVVLRILQRAYFIVNQTNPTLALP